MSVVLRGGGFGIFGHVRDGGSGISLRGGVVYSIIWETSLGGLSLGMLSKRRGYFGWWT